MRNGGQCNMHTLWFTLIMTIIPVSYTHLDVYKRQTFTCEKLTSCYFLKRRFGVAFFSIVSICLFVIHLWNIALSWTIFFLVQFSSLLECVQTNWAGLFSKILLCWVHLIHDSVHGCIFTFMQNWPDHLCYSPQYCFPKTPMIWLLFSCFIYKIIGNFVWPLLVSQSGNVNHITPPMTIHCVLLEVQVSLLYST